MALKYQKYIDFPDGKMIGYHVYEPTANTHTLTVPEMARYNLGTAGDSVKQLSGYGQVLMGTAPQAGSAYVVTITTTAAERALLVNQEVIIVTNHRIRKGNYLPEA